MLELLVNEKKLTVSVRYIAVIMPECLNIFDLLVISVQDSSSHLHSQRPALNLHSSTCSLVEYPLELRLEHCTAIASASQMMFADFGVADASPSA